MRGQVQTQPQFLSKLQPNYSTSISSFSGVNTERKLRSPLGTRCQRCRLRVTSCFHVSEDFTHCEVLLTVQTVGLEPDSRHKYSGYTVQKWAQKLHRYRNCASTIVPPLGTNSVLKSASQHFLQFCATLFTIFARFLM